MSSNLIKYNEAVEHVQAEIAALSRNEGHLLNVGTVKKFLYESITYLSTLTTASAGKTVASTVNTKKGNPGDQLSEWFSVLSQILPQLFSWQIEHEKSCTDTHNIITYLNHMSFHLVKIKEIPLEWHRFLGKAVLEFLAVYAEFKDSKADFIADVVLKSYMFLGNAAQAKEKSSKSLEPASIKLCYELYLIGSGILCLNRSSQAKDGLKTAKDVLYNYTQIMSAENEKKGDSRELDESAWPLRPLVDLAVTVYALQPRVIADDFSLSYYVELFRFVEEDKTLREKLLACEGNLFKYMHTQMTDKTLFPCDATEKLMENNCEISMQELKESKVQDVIIKVLELVHSLRIVMSEQHQEINKQARGKQKKNATPSDTLINVEVVEEVEPVIATIQAWLAESSRPLGTALGDCLTLFANVVPAPKLTGTRTLLTCFKLISLSVEIFVRDIIAHAAKESQAKLASLRVYTMAVANKTRMAMLQVLLTREDLGEESVSEIAALQKSTLTALCVLVQTVKKKNLLTSLPNSFKQTFKSLESAMCGLGTIGRQLRRMEMFSCAVTLLSPLWPVASMEELLPFVSHHETLAECYRQISEPEKACRVIAEAAKLHENLLSEPLVKTLARILREETSVSVLKIFEPCKNDEDKHAQILVKVARHLQSSSQSSVAKQTMSVLRCLSKHKGLTSLERGVHLFLLAECVWFNDSTGDSDNKLSANSEAVSLVTEAMTVLCEDTSHKYDDMLAQCAFLHSEILHRLSCVDKSKESEDPSSVDGIESMSSPSSHDSGPPQTPLGLAATPKVTLSFSTPGQATPVIPRKDQRVRGREKNLGQQQLPEVDGEMLMTKATTCLTVWTHWFKQHGAGVIEETDGLFRADKSLEFLQRIADLAIVNHQTVTALQALCRARNLADMIKREEVIKRITGTLVSVLPQLGVRCDTRKSDNTNDDGDNDDVFLEELGLGHDGHVIQLAAVAAHHLQAGQLEKFVHVYKVATQLIEKSREKGPLTPNVTIALAVLKRLNAEFFSLPGMVRNSNSEDAALDEIPYPIELAGESIRYITGVTAFYLGTQFKNADSRGPSIDTWRVIHEYLCTMKVSGELFLHAGNMKYARTHFAEGWLIAKSCLLNTWTAFFLSRLVDVLVLYQDSTKSAQSYLKTALNLMRRHSHVCSEAETAECSRVQPPTDIGSGMFSCHVHSSGRKKKSNVCSCQTDNDVKDVNVLRKQLLPENIRSSELTLSMLEEENEPMDDGEEEFRPQIMCHSGSCDRCFQPEISRTICHLMRNQAEILTMDKRSHNTIVQLLHAAGCSAQRLTELSHSQHVKEIVEEWGPGMCLLPQNVNINSTQVLDTMYRLAEIYFQHLYMMEQSEDTGKAGKSVGAETVTKLLDTIVTEGKKLGGLAKSNIVVASAQLLRIHLGFTSVLKKCVEDEEDTAETLEDVGGNAKDEEIIASAVNVAKKEKEYWDTQRKQQLKALKTKTTNPSLTKSSVYGKVGKTDSVTAPGQQMGSVKRLMTKTKSIHIFSDSATPQSQQQKAKLTKKSVSVDVYNIDAAVGESPSLNSLQAKHQGKAGLAQSSTVRRGRAKKAANSIAGKDEEEDNTQKLSPLSHNLSKLSLRDDNVEESMTEEQENKENTSRKVGISGKRPQGNIEPCTPSSSTCNESLNELSSPAICLQKHRELMLRLSEKKTKTTRERICGKDGDNDDDVITTDSVGIKKTNRQRQRRRGAGQRKDGKIETQSEKEEDRNVSVEQNDYDLDADIDAEDLSKSPDMADCSSETVKCPKTIRRKRTAKKNSKKDNTEAVEATAIVVNEKPARRGRKKAPKSDSPESKRENSLVETPEMKIQSWSLHTIIDSPMTDIVAESYDSAFTSDADSDKENYRVIRNISDENHKQDLTHSFGILPNVLKEVNMNRLSYGNDINLTSPIELPRGRPQRKKATTATDESKENNTKVPTRARRGVRKTSAKQVTPTLVPEVERDSHLEKEGALSSKENFEAIVSKFQTPPKLEITPARIRTSKLSLKKNRRKPVDASSPTETEPSSEKSTPIANITNKYVDLTDKQNKTSRKSDDACKVQNSPDEETKSSPQPKVISRRKRGAKHNVSSLSSSSERKSPKRSDDQDESAANGNNSSATESSPLTSVQEKLRDMELDDIDNDSLMVETVSAGEECLQSDLKVLGVSQQETLGLMRGDGDVPVVGERLADHEMQDENTTEPNIKPLAVKFPTLTVYEQETPVSRLTELKDALLQIQHFPHSFLARQICRSIALVKWEDEVMGVSDKENRESSSVQHDIAAYLMESMHITFQHLMTRNLYSKLRKCKDTPAAKATEKLDKKKSSSQAKNNTDDWSSLKGEELQMEREAMTDALSTLAFGGNIVEKFCGRLASIPDDWTVVQLTVVDFDPSNPFRGQLFVTRLTSTSDPITVGLPYKRWHHFRRAMRVYEEAVKHEVENITPEQYWNIRYKSDKDMRNLIFYLQEFFLCGHKWLLRGQESWVKGHTAQKLLDSAAQNACQTVLKQHRRKLSYRTVRVLMEVLLYANEKDTSSLLECVWPPKMARCLTQMLMQAQRDMFSVCERPMEKNRGPVVLILDKALNKVPWECMPHLKSDTVTRVPSLAALQALLTLHQKRAHSPYQCGVRRDSAVAVVDPETNLQNSANFLVPQFQQYKGWTCLSQKAPTVTDLKSFLTDYSLYLYCGHGWGKQFVGGDDLQMFRGKAVAVIMGCHSGKLEYKAKMEGDGAPLYFLLAGCPAVVGNLWLVTDKDIDKLTSNLVSHWMSQSQPISLAQILSSARRVCKLVGLNGFAPVVYGLPVTMNT